MKKTIVFILIIALVLVLIPSLIYAKPGWGQIQKDWAGEIYSNNSGLTYDHVMFIDSLNPSTGDIELSGINITAGSPWTASGNISGNVVTFTRPFTSGRVIEYVGSISEDGNFMSGTFSFPNFGGVPTTGTWQFESLIEEHTKAENLIKSGVPGKGLDNAPGLDKPFNPKSQAGENAGQKKD